MILTSYGTLAKSGVPPDGNLVSVQSTSPVLGLSIDGGANWTNPTPPAGITGLFDIVYSRDLGKYLSVNSNTGTYITSTDGTNWDSFQLNTFIKNFRSIDWSPVYQRFAIVRNTQITQDNAGFADGTGTTFVYKALTVDKTDGYDWNRVRWGRDKFVATAKNDVFAYSFFSAGNIFWNSVAKPDIGTTRDLIYVDRLNQWFSTGAGSTMTNLSMAKSSDGINWSIVSGVTGDIGTITWSDRLRLLVAAGTDKILTSRDGNQWDTIEVMTSQSLFSGFSFIPNYGFYGVGLCLGCTAGSTDEQSIVSTDGINWSANPYGLSFNRVEKMTYGGWR